MRSFRAESGAGFGEIVIGEVTINDESNLDRSYFSFAYIFSFGFHFLHLSEIFFFLRGELQCVVNKEVKSRRM